MQQKITTFLTFDCRAEEAVDFYTSIFENSRILSTTRYEAGGPWSDSELMSTATFELAGQTFVALNGGPSFTFSQGTSLLVECEDQDEIDELWTKLTDGGEPGACGALTDRFGVSWKVVPRMLGELLGDEDRARAGRVMLAMLRMSKIEIEELQRAYDGVEASLL